MRKSITVAGLLMAAGLFYGGGTRLAVAWGDEPTFRIVTCAQLAQEQRSGWVRVIECRPRFMDAMVAGDGSLVIPVAPVGAESRSPVGAVVVTKDPQLVEIAREYQRLVKDDPKAAARYIVDNVVAVAGERDYRGLATPIQELGPRTQTSFARIPNVRNAYTVIEQGNTPPTKDKTSPLIMLIVGVVCLFGAIIVWRK